MKHLCYQIRLTGLEKNNNMVILPLYYLFAGHGFSILGRAQIYYFFIMVMNKANIVVVRPIQCPMRYLGIPALIPDLRDHFSLFKVLFVFCFVFSGGGCLGDKRGILSQVIIRTFCIS